MKKLLNSKENNMLISYIRKNGKPVGCVVGFNNNGEIGIGVSLCNSKDKFDKKRARELASIRAVNSLGNELKGFPGWSDENGRHEWLPDSKKDLVYEAYDNMLKRCTRKDKGIVL